jgi:hypothetical protein
MQIISKMKGKAFFGRIAVAGVLIILLALLLLKSPLLDPVVSIQTKDFPAQQSQLFYKSGGSYSERNSKVSKLRQTDQTFRFSLPVYDDLLRWDPLERSGRFSVESVTISTLGYKVVVASNEVSAALQIEKIRGESTALQFVVPEGAKDPQILVHINSNHLDRIRLLIAVAISVFAFVLIVACAVFRDQVRLCAARWRVYLNCVKRCLSNEYFTSTEFLSFLGIGVFLNIVPMVNFFLSVDDEAGAIRMDPSVWIADGRWTAFLVEKFIFPQPVLPFVPNLFFYSCLAVSYMFLLRTYKLKFYWVTALAYCIFVAHPIWWFIGEFYSNIPSTGVGILALCLALYIISKIDLASAPNKAKLTLAISSSVFLSVAIGAYQSLVMFYLVGGMAAILFGCTSMPAENSTEVKLTLKRLATLIVILFVGLLFYQAINKFAQFVYPSSRGYIDGFLRIDELLADPMRIFLLVLKEMWKLYSGSIKTYGVSFFSSTIMLGLAIMFLVSKKTWSAAALSIMCICGMLFSPFLLHFVTGAVYLPLRSMLAISLVVCVAVIIVLERGGVYRVPGIVISLVLLFQMISVNGLYSASTILATTHDRLTAEALHLRMAALHPLMETSTPIYVDIYGKLSFATRYPAPDSSTMGASLFNWDGGNANRMLTYMRVLGLGNVYALQREKSISLTPEFDDMPIWPAEGSVRYKDGVYLVRLSDEPDPAHAKYSNGDVIK